MTDPADLSTFSYKRSLERAHSGGHRAVHAPILQSLTQPRHPKGAPDALTPPKLPSPPQQPAQDTLAGAAEGQPGSKHTPSGSGGQHKRPRYRDTTMTAAAAAAAATAAAAAAAAIARQAGVGRNRFAAQAPKAQQQTPGRFQFKTVVPLSAAALDAVGAPCRIGGDLPPESLQSHRGSGADVVGVRPYHHLHMMQLHHQRQQQHQQHQQQKQQAICAQAQAQSVWGWNVAGSAAQIAT